LFHSKKSYLGLKIKKTFSNWLSERYLLIIRNEENFAEKSSVSFTYAKMILLVFFMIMLFLTISLFLTKSLLAQWFDPRHDQIENRKHLFELTVKLDSLEEEVERKDVFIGTFRQMLAGNFDSTGFVGDRTEFGFSQNIGDVSKIAMVDSLFRLEFERNEGNILSYNNAESSELTETFFFAPIGGYVSRAYNIQDEHFGSDIVAKENEPIMSVANGTVILSSWTQDSGYVLAIQHSDNLISVYKHNSGLLKKVGNFVLGGEVIAVIGNTGELTDGPHLHFELWYKGNPVNPEDFVSF
jgi:murein DD-endopeptidase MepM/ murein hydrolase activator NlpD